MPREETRREEWGSGVGSGEEGVARKRRRVRRHRKEGGDAVKCGHKWSKEVKSGHRWSKVVKSGQKWSKGVEPLVRGLAVEHAQNGGRTEGAAGGETAESGQTAVKQRPNSGQTAIK